MKELNLGQTKQISGGNWSTVFKIVFTTMVNIGDYIIYKKNRHEKITIQGLAMAAGSGMIVGSATHTDRMSDDRLLIENTL